MKICDRHYHLDGSCLPATEEVTFIGTGEQYHLCSSCADTVRDCLVPPVKLNLASAVPEPKPTFMIVETEDEKRRGRPRKTA